MLLDTLEHGRMLLFIMGDSTVEFRSELDGSFSGIVERREAVDERLEGAVVAVVVPIFSRLREEGGFEPVEL